MRERSTSRDRFAADVLSELRRVGVRHADYRARQFAIVCDAGQDMFSWLFLARPFVEYERNPADRKRLVREFVASSLAPADGPETLEEARPRLRVALRGATYGGADLLRRPALPFLDEVVLVDHPRTYLDEGYPRRWEVSVEEVFANARTGMESRAAELDGVTALGRSVLHVPDYTGGQVVSRILLDGWLAALTDHVGGRPVAFVPSNLMLLICVDEPVIVKRLFQLAADEYARTARPLSPMGYTPDAEGRLTVYSPAPDHPAYHASGRAYRRLLVDSAEGQRLTSRDPRFVACSLVARSDGSTFTEATWRVGSSSLLPPVDYVGIREPGEKLYFVSWAALAEADLLDEDVELRPTRFRTSTRPSASALGYLRERAITP